MASQGRDSAANLTISSPLEAHKGHNLVFAVAGLDMGFDNPVFAAIELDYADADQVRRRMSIIMCKISNHARKATHTASGIKG